MLDFLLSMGCNNGYKDYLREARKNNLLHIYHQKPSYVSAIAYDTAAILFKALATATAYPDDPDSIREALTQMAPHDGLTGKSWFEENGEVERKVTLVRIRNNTFEAIGEE